MSTVDLYRPLLAALIVVAAFVAPSSAPAASSATEALRIGIVERPGPRGERLADGAARAAARRSGAGAVDGRPVQLVSLTPEGPWDAVASVLGRAVFEHRLHALVGAFDGADAHAAAQLATRARIPVITLSGEVSLTEAKDPWVFRGLPRDDRQALAVLGWAARGNRPRRARILVPEGREGRERHRAVREACDELGIEVVADADDLGTTRGAPDILALWLDPEEALDFLEGQHPGSSSPVILGSLRLDTPEFRQAAARLPAPVAIPRLPDVDETADRPPSGSPERPAASGQDAGAPCSIAGASLAAAAGHDMVEALARVADQHGLDPLRIREGLLQAEGFTGCTGTFSFDARGDRVGAIAVEVLPWHSPASGESRTTP